MVLPPIEGLWVARLSKEFRACEAFDSWADQCHDALLLARGIDEGEHMSVTNAISSVIIVGALIAAGATALDQAGQFSKGVGVLAVILASINIFGGFMVTQRMLAMYKKKEKPAAKPKAEG